MTRLSVHDLTPEQYEAIQVREQDGRTARWKQVDTPSISIVFFRPTRVFTADESEVSYGIVVGS